MVPFTENGCVSLEPAALHAKSNEAHPLPPKPERFQPSLSGPASTWTAGHQKSRLSVDSGLEKSECHLSAAGGGTSVQCWLCFKHIQQRLLQPVWINSISHWFQRGQGAKFYLNHGNSVYAKLKQNLLSLPVFLIKSFISIKL